MLFYKNSDWNSRIYYLKNGDLIYERNFKNCLMNDW